jgi:ATP/ADP translocase
MRSWLARWLDLRPDEVRIVALSFCGAFLAIAFLVLARSLRETFYLTAFPVETLPYITVTVALLSVPTVALFARLLSRGNPHRVLVGLLIVLAIGLAALWPVVGHSGSAVIGFYVWTALGTLLLTSGFWLLAAELFPVRGAKRLFGLIGAGGTAGAIVMGNTLAWLSDWLQLSQVVPGLILILSLFLLVLVGLSSRARWIPTRPEDTARSSLREGFGLSWRTPHLRTIALVVATATIASTLVDYQFKEFARATMTTPEALAGFFGSFYGWAGGAALLLQVFVSARLMRYAGIAVTLSILPLILLLGSAGFLLAPGLVIATILRGGDTSLRKSLHRSVLEVLYVPVPTALRRKTKTFIDSVADSTAEGMGAGIVFLIVTMGGLSSRTLSIFVLGFAGILLWLARRAGRSYVAMVTSQLRVGADAAAARTDQRDLLSSTFTRIDLRPALEDAGGVLATVSLASDGGRASAIVEEARAASGRMPVRGGETPQADEPGAAAGPGAGAGSGIADKPGLRGSVLAEQDVGAESLADLEADLESTDPARIRNALDGIEEWEERHVPTLVRLLARDELYRSVARLLGRMELSALPYLAPLLPDDSADFVLRRRVPGILASYESSEAEAALLAALTAPRFEIRYRVALALVHRRGDASAGHAPGMDERVWEAVRLEVARERPVWELQRLLDDDPADDELVSERVEVRGQLSLEHSFRLLSLVLDPEAVRSAYQGLTLGDEGLRSLALEYLDQVLPGDVKERLWPFIGDLSEYQQARRARPLRAVVSDLVTTGATLFGSEGERQALRKLLDEQSDQ